MSSAGGLVLHPDRLLPPDPTVRAIARRLHDATGVPSPGAGTGFRRGHGTVADDTFRAWGHECWSAASPHVRQPDEEVAASRAALLGRVGDRRIRRSPAQLTVVGAR